MKVEVLGVKIDDLNMAEALSVVEKWIWNPGPPAIASEALRAGKHYIVTPNPEMVVAAQKDPIFKKILNGADLSIPDGVGLRLSGKLRNTFPGTDFMEKLVSLAAEKGFVVGFLGGEGEVAIKCAECLKKKYPGLKVAFAENGGEVDDDGNVIACPQRSACDSRRARKFTLSERSESNGRQSTVEDRHTPIKSGFAMTIKPVDILFVAFGHIKQEKWIAANLKNMPVKLAMGVGGAFDYLSGSVPRAPKWMRALGFEWLFRLIAQPRRIKRQLMLFKYLWLIMVK